MVAGSLSLVAHLELASAEEHICSEGGLMQMQRIPKPTKLCQMFGYTCADDNCLEQLMIEKAVIPLHLN